MKKIAAAIIFLAIAVLSHNAGAQILKPVHWTYSAKKLSATEAVIFLKATIDPGWHVYSQHVKDGGPVKTSFTFEASRDYELKGATQEPKPVTRKEKVFDDMEIGFFEHSVVFQQKIRLKTAQTVVKGRLEYMTCNDSQCLPPADIDFTITVK